MTGSPGLRVVMDVRALQEPARAPRTAAYLEGLLGAFDADPLPGESFAFLLASDEDDPTTRFDRLDVIGRRLLPPIRLLRSAALTIDASSSSSSGGIGGNRVPSMARAMRCRSSSGVSAIRSMT